MVNADNTDCHGFLHTTIKPVMIPGLQQASVQSVLSVFY